MTWAVVVRIFCDGSAWVRAESGEDVPLTAAQVGPVELGEAGRLVNRDRPDMRFVGGEAMAKTEYVTVRLTRLEAEALEAAAGNSLVSVEDAYSVLLTKERVAAGFRAQKKMQAAIWAPK